MKTNKLTLAALAATAILGWSTQSQADTLVSVDFTYNPFNSVTSTATGAGILSEGSNLWNGIEFGWNANTYTNQALTDSNGNASGVTFTSATWLAYNLGSLAPGTPAAAVDVMSDYLYKAGESLSYTIGGLTPNATYDLVVYSGTPTINAGTAAITINGSAWGSVTGSESFTANGEGYFRGFATANGSGNIVVSTGLSTDPIGGLYYSIANGFQIAIPGGSAFATWAGEGVAFNADANNDGVDNGLAWVLGALDKDANAIALLPTLDNTTDPDFFIFTYRRDDDANTDPNTAIKVEYGSDLSGWTPAVAGVDIIITPTDDGAGVGIDLVQVKIRRTLAVGGKLFARLNAVNTP